MQSKPRNIHYYGILELASSSLYFPVCFAFYKPQTVEK